MKKNQTQTAEKESAAVQTAGTRLVNLPRTAMMLSDLNPRKTFDESAIEELAASIREQGLLQPVTVRPVMSGMYEVVCGARRFKAVSLLGWETVPAIVRELDDAAALDAMITENLQRRDVDPLEESEAFRLLVAQGQTVEDLAARFGKSDKYIRGRLSLSRLIEPLADALRTGHLSLTAALRLSRLTDEQQEDCWHDCTDDEDSGIGIIGENNVLDFIRLESQSLDDAAFLDKDMGEDWNAGAHPRCAGCPFNSASQSSLFPELSKNSSCLNGACFEAKSLSWQDWVISQYRDRFVLKGVEPQPGDILLRRSYTWGKEEKRMKATAAELEQTYEIFEDSSFITVYNEKDNGSDVFVCLDLGRLVRGYDPLVRVRFRRSQSAPAAASGKTEWGINYSLTNLRLRRNEAVTKALEPIFKKHVDAERLLTADNTVLDAVIARACSDFGGYYLMNELDLHVTDSLVDALMGWVDEHSLRELIALTALKVCEHGTMNERGSLLQYLTFALEPERSKEATDNILHTMQKREDKLLAELQEIKNKND